MGTRADFYIREKEKMEWLGSIAYDGYLDGIEKSILESKDIESFSNNVKNFLKERDDSTFPKDGWPWPWEDSLLTDYSYIYENGKVMASCFGCELFDPLIINEEDNENQRKKLVNYFPDMTKIQNVAFGAKSGIIIMRKNN